MKIAITSTGTDLDAAVDPRFGRARYILVCDRDGGGVVPVDNTPNLNAAQGAGIQAAKLVKDHGATAVITGNCGPKAFQALAAAGVDVYLVPDGTAAEALERFRSGALTPQSKANVAGHWS